MKKTLVERFWANLVKLPPEFCWVWNGTVGTTGYGQIKQGEKLIKAHRLSYEIHFGPIPKGKTPLDNCVCHTCDNRKCCNPSHLFLGSHQDNMDDMSRKGRHAAKLNFAKVKAIRKSKLSHRVLAAKYGVHHKSIEKVKARERWAFV